MDNLSVSVDSEILDQKERLLTNRLSELESVLVAYSGGVDSATLAYYARMVLGEKARIVIAVSPSLSAQALSAARAQALLFEWDLIEIETDEIELREYQQNDNMRCFFCKATLFDRLSELAGKWNINHIAYGANLDDDADFRPGQMAADQFCVVAPLKEAGLSKSEIRLLAFSAGLPSWDRPQDACLASRIPTDVPVTIDTLSQVERAEACVRSLGFKQVRVRHLGTGAVVEIGVDELPRFTEVPELRRRVEIDLAALGYQYTEIDPQGYRQGALSAPEFVKYRSQHLARI